jgi:hypothetical protein
MWGKSRAFGEAPERLRARRFDIFISLKCIRLTLKKIRTCVDQSGAVGTLVQIDIQHGAALQQAKMRC